jgi:rhodanese-related sulfurtransferase
MQPLISTSELALALQNQDSSLILLEALPAPHFSKEHLPSAQSLPLDQLDGRISQLAPKRDQSIVVYCSGPTCNNSHTAAARLRQLGYSQVRVYAEGKLGWREAGFAFES